MAPTTTPVDLEICEDVAVLTIDNPPVNALSHDVRVGLRAGLQAAAADPAVRAVVLVCRGRTFIAGADITEFDRGPQEPTIPEVIELIEKCPRPVIASIHGSALGGGLEVALACHYRVASSTARFGFPEVKLGLLPGGGGTQRLPRLVGVDLALKMIVLGEPIGTDEALREGLIDMIVEGDMTKAGIAFARAGRRVLRRVRDLEDRIGMARGKLEVFEAFRGSLPRASRRLPAPARCVAAVEAAVALPFDRGLARERELFAELLASPESRAQRYFFFAEREAAKVPDLRADTPIPALRKAAVLGAGTMGAGIAMNFANSGIAVTVVEASREALDRGLDTIRANYEATASKGRLSREDVARRIGLITGSLGYDDLAGADIVVEAVFEDMALKKDVFARVDGLVRADTIVATNTSTLDLDELAGVTRHPENVIGMHFFSPANVMKLLEVVRGAKTSSSAIATVMSLAKRMGKVPVLVGVCHGFVGNRILLRRDREAERLLLEGALPQQVDKVLYDFGFPMGPFAMHDLAGLDVSWRIRKGTGTTWAVGDRLCRMERFGQKSGAGYYRYQGRDRTPMPDPEVERLILELSRESGIERRLIPDDEILARLVYPMIDEGARILEDRIATRASDIDVIWVYGYGWPVYRGGPMFWADQIGLKAIRDRMLELEERFGEGWRPAPLLTRLAEEGGKFIER